MPTHYTISASFNSFESTGEILVSQSLVVTGSVTSTTNFTGSLLGTSSWAFNSITASYMLGSRFDSSNLARSASHALTASFPGGSLFPFSGSAQITGSLGITGSFSVCGSGYGGGPRNWITGGPLIVTRNELAGVGTQDAGLVFGGNCAFPLAQVGCTEEYNGTSWVAGLSLNTARTISAGAGTQNSGLAIGGGNPRTTCTEEYNGTSWTAGCAMLVARSSLAGAGIQNAAVAFGGLGNIPPSPATVTLKCTEEYDGISWFVGCSLILARHVLAGAGTQNAGLAFGGDCNPGLTACTEEYNGTSWLAGGNLITSRSSLAGAGTQNAALAFGGNSPSTVSCTEEYNGISWVSGGNLIIPRVVLAGAGTQTAGLAAGGSNIGLCACTEEYTTAVSFNCIVNIPVFSYCFSADTVVLPQVSSSLNFANDTEARDKGGVPLGGIYRTDGLIKVRVS